MQTKEKTTKEKAPKDKPSKKKTTREPAAEEPVRHTAVRSSRERKLSAQLVVWRVFAIIAFTVAALLCGALYLAKAGILFIPDIEPTPEPTPVPTISITCYIPDGSTIVVPAGEDGMASLPEGPQIPGYTFLGWADEQGRAEKRAQIRLYENLSYSARYAIAFRDESGAKHHEAYLKLDETQFFRPKDALTRGQAVEILYSLLDTTAVGSGRFTDVDSSASCYAAAATLKDLGVLSGSRLHPDEPISYGDFFQLLGAFFPESTTEQSFEQIAPNDPYRGAFALAAERGWLRDPTVSPYDELPRREAVVIFNALCGRTGAAHEDLADVGAIADISPRDPDFAAIADAVVSHDCTIEEGVEKWSASTPLPLLKPGLFFLGTELHCIGPDGLPVISAEAEGFAFDEDGVITSGDAELDRLVREKLPELIDPEEMSGEEMLQAVYDYVTYKLAYLGGKTLPVGETGWEIEAARKMLSSGKGNCYNFAAAFWAMSRAIGYDTVCYSGLVDTQRHPHGWAEITIDGTTYIFDPTMENEERFITYKFGKYFMRTYESVVNWSYTRG